MARILTKLRELRNADVRFISLVDRASTRIPFRVIKQDKETTMDLSKIFKRDQQPEVAAVVVREQSDPALASAIQTAITAAGFSVDRVKKADEVVIYEQTDNQDNVQLVRLSGDVVLAVKGFVGSPDGDFGEMVSAQGFFSGVNGALDVAFNKILSILGAAETPKDCASEVQTLMSDLSEYVVALVKGLPSAAFKIDAEVRKIVAEAEEAKKSAMLCSKCQTEITAKEDTPVEIPVEVPVEKSEEVAEEKPKETPVEAVVEEPVVAVEKTDMTEELVETPEQKARKEDSDRLAALLTAVQSIAEKVDGVTVKMETLSTQVKEVATKQELQEKTLDDVAKKSETLSMKLSNTVVALPGSEDKPTQVAKKVDTDLRTGHFDTAMLGRRR